MRDYRRVIVYVDGFNLYFGLRARGWRRFYWLDLLKLSRSFLRHGQTLQRCHYFTARVAADAPGSQRRQSVYLDALQTLPAVIVHFGHYLRKSRDCKHCGSSWTSFEEKMTDVNIATQLLVDAYEDRFDTAVVVSGDSDLVTPIEHVLQRFPDKRVLVAFPPKRRSDHLRRIATSSFVIGRDRLRKCQLPEQIRTASGYVLQRPDTWR